MRPELRNSFRSSHATLESDEALRAPPGALAGVSAAAEAALAGVNIGSVFDLAVAQLFVAAARLEAIAGDPTSAEARLNVVASDLANPPAGVPVTELASQPIAILRAAGGNAAALAAGLDVATVRELAHWPPFVAAKAVLADAYFPEQTPGFDPDAPDDLLPKNRVYPTERVFFRKLVMDTVPGDGATPIEAATAIDLATALAGPGGFDKLATGALLTFSQSWFSQGLTLGQLLHSTSLAPGESTRIAVIDWSRRSTAAASESISESELLSNTMAHSRSISEVTTATASEFQSGRSSTKANSTTEQIGGGGGFELGPFAVGASAATSTTTTEVMSASSSFGARDLAASMAQEINDRSQQNASSVRNRRASVVREVSQSEHEAISTRVVTNYNHMHALSVHYYEVVQAFRTTTQMERAEFCLFVPVKLVDFAEAAVVDRWRLVLADAALSERVRRQLTVEYGVVEIVPETPRITPGGLVVSDLFDRSVMTASRATTAAAAAAAEAGAAEATPAAPAPAAAAAVAAPALTYVRAPLSSPMALLAVKGWNIEQLNRIGWSTGRVLMQAGSDSVFVSDDALVVGFALKSGEAARFVIRLHTGEELVPASSTRTGVSFASPVAITDIESISAQTAGTQPGKTSLVLQLNLLGTVMPLDVPVVLKPMSVPAVLMRLGGVKASRELVAHLEANRLHYTQAILRSLDAATAAALVGRFTYRGIPLGQLVDAQPIAVTANYLVFKTNVGAERVADDDRWSEAQAEWRRWLQQRGLERPAPRSEIIPLPSGGVFAEAVLGRYNAAEKTDLSRFWNWQDSPIPIAAPEIAAVQAGSRAQSDAIAPGQLSSPILNIQSPSALPDPTGMAAILAAIQNGSMFRDMSGMAQTAALAQAALQATAAGATSVGQQAGQNLSTVMTNNTERMKIAAQLLAAMAGVPAPGGGNSLGGRPTGNVTEEGARLNYAKGLDAQGAGAGGGSLLDRVASLGSTGGGGAAGSGGLLGGLSSGLASGGTEGALFNRLTGGSASGLVGNALAGLGGGGGGGSGGGSGGGEAAPTPPAQALNDPAPRWVFFRFTFGTTDILLPQHVRGAIGQILRTSPVGRRVMGHYRIGGVTGDFELYPDELWLELPTGSSHQSVGFGRRTTATGAYLMAELKPKPLYFPPTVYEPETDDTVDYVRTGEIMVDFSAFDVAGKAVQVDVILPLIYFAVTVTPPQTVREGIVAMNIRPQDVVYVSLPRPVAGGLLHDVVIWGSQLHMQFLRPMERFHDEFLPDE